jgi:hypothetical protein
VIKLNVFDEKRFREEVGESLGNDLERAVIVLNNFGPRLSADVTNVILHAIDKKMVAEVLALLEEHWEKYLCYQHPSVRGTVRSWSGINETKALFLRICQEVLKLEPTITTD